MSYAGFYKAACSFQIQAQEDLGLGVLAQIYAQLNEAFPKPYSGDEAASEHPFSGFAGDTPSLIYSSADGHSFLRLSRKHLTVCVTGLFESWNALLSSSFNALDKYLQTIPNAEVRHIGVTLEQRYSPTVPLDELGSVFGFYPSLPSIKEGTIIGVSAGFFDELEVNKSGLITQIGTVFNTDQEIPPIGLSIVYSSMVNEGERGIASLRLIADSGTTKIDALSVSCAPKEG